MKYVLLYSVLVTCTPSSLLLAADRDNGISATLTTFGNTIALAHAGMDELAEERKLAPDEAGAIIVLWDLTACELYNEAHEGDADISVRKLDQMAKKCRRVIAIKKTNLAAYYQAAAKAKKIDTTSISLTWVQKMDGNTFTRILVTDNKNTCLLASASYDDTLNGNTTSHCIAQPWKLTMATEFQTRKAQ